MCASAILFLYFFFSAGFTGSVVEESGGADLLAEENMTPRVMLTSPKHGFYEFDSLDQSSDNNNNALAHSTASLNSNSSH